jgi:hypothetical protein
MHRSLRLIGFVVFGTLSLVSSCSEDESGGSGGVTNCAAVCDLPRSCPNDPDKSQCINECEAMAKICPSQARALNKCTLATSSDDFACDEFGESALKPDICEAETSAMFACFLGGTDLTFGVGSDTTPSSNGTTSATSNRSTGTPDATEATDGMSSDTSRGIDSVAPSADKSVDCDDYCAITQSVNCGETLDTCLTRCEQDEVDLPAECVAALNSTIECVRVDPTTRLTCEGTEPVISDTACGQQQTEFISCAIRGQVPAEDQTACAEACDGVDLTPPISCPNDQAADCELSCIVAVAILGSGCANASVAASACSASADASEWSCDDEGQATFDGATCETEQAALFACISG